MKILHILDHSLPLHSGYTFRSQNIFREQRKRGWDPIVATSPKHEQAIGKPVAPLEEINGFKYYRSGLIPKNSLPGVTELLLIKILAKRIKEICLQEGPDIIHAHSPVLNALAALWVGRRLKIPVVYEIRAFWEDAAVDHGTTHEGSARYRITRSMETYASKRADHLCVICEGLKKDLVQRGVRPGKISVIYNGINPTDFSPVPPDQALAEKWSLKGKTVIGFLGSFYRYEGLDLLLKACEHLSRKYPDLALLLVGGGEMESELRHLCAQLNIMCISPEDTEPSAPEEKPTDLRVIFGGRIAHDRIPGTYALVDILVYPRYSMRLTELVTPLKPLEAMAMAKPLIASDVGGHRELITDGSTGLLFHAGDQRDLEKKLELLLIDHRLREQLRANARTWVINNHSWHKTTAPYEQVYENLI